MIPLGGKALFQSLIQLRPGHLVVHTHALPSVCPPGSGEVFCLAWPAWPPCLPFSWAVGICQVSWVFLLPLWHAQIIALLPSYPAPDWPSHLGAPPTPLHAKCHECTCFRRGLAHGECSMTGHYHTAASYLYESSSSPGAPPCKYPRGSLFSAVGSIHQVCVFPAQY